MRRVITVLLFGALIVALAIRLAPNLGTRVVGVGELLWPGYAADLRQDPEKPKCNLQDLEQRLQQCPAQGAEQPKTTSGDKDDPFGGEDPFAEEGLAKDPFGGDDPFADDDPFAEKPEVNCPALHKAYSLCQTRHDDFHRRSKGITDNLRAFRSVEAVIRQVAEVPWLKHLLVILLLLGATAATAKRVHIALRHPRTVLEHVANQLGQLTAHMLWFASCVADYRVQRYFSEAETENPNLPLIWAAGFLVLGAINVVHLVRQPKDELQGQGSLVRLLMVVPLYVYMAIIGGVYFLIVEGHWSGQAIYLHKFAQHADIYIGIGLYIFAGMLLSQTKIAKLAFGVLHPFRLPPAILAWLVVVLAAIPTAYSGASGIFVIAAGAVIFEQLRAEGASPRLALAATAMSGSLGVVLRPCLVVVLITILNNEVTTDQLFGWGLYVFGLTAFLFLVAMLLRNDQLWRPPPMKEATAGSVSALMPLLPYIGVGTAILAFNAFGLATWLNEHTAPQILPMVLLGLVIYDRTRGRTDEEPGLWQPMASATSESSSHIGALLFVMVGSVGLGGVVERAEVMALVPESLGSTFTTMCILVVIMVLVGMTMDALGAVVLVSATVATIATDNNINPVHFWMMVLVAFELGYLTPPVAINHLLARQVIGGAARVENNPAEGGVFRQYENLLIPMAVMGTALLLVAFVPLFFYG